MLFQPLNGAPANAIILHKVFQRSFVKRAEQKVTFCFNMVEKFQIHDSKLEQNFGQKFSETVRQKIFPFHGGEKKERKKESTLVSYYKPIYSD